VSTRSLRAESHQNASGSYAAITLIEFEWTMRAAVVLMIVSILASAAPAASSASSAKRKKSHTHSTRHSSSVHHSRSRSRQGRRNAQSAPTPGRYQEIQQALASRGYYTGPVDGKWNSDSVDALKRFQTDQNLTPDGKLTSLSLIAMGLGPRRANGTAPPKGPPASPGTQPPGSLSARPATSGAPVSVQQSNPAPASPSPADAH